MSFEVVVAPGNRGCEMLFSLIFHQASVALLVLVCCVLVFGVSISRREAAGYLLEIEKYLLKMFIES